MSNFRTNYRIKSIDNKDYTMKNDASVHKMKILNLERLTKDPFTGTWTEAFKNGSAKAQVFPFVIVSADNALGYGFEPNPIYNRVEMAKANGIKYPVAFKRWDTSDFNFPSDATDAPKRNSLNVSVLVDEESETDEQITNNLLGQAMYQLRKIGVTIFNEYMQVAMYTPRGSKTEIPAISSTEAQHAQVIEDAKKRTASLKKAVDNVKKDDTTGTPNPVEFDEVATRIAIKAANPTAKKPELDKLLLEAMDVFDTANAVNTP